MKKNVLRTLVRTTQGTVKKNSPAILTGMAIAGVVTTSVMAVKATPKAMQILEAAEGELTKADILKMTWKVYAPAALMGAATITCMIGANHINIRRNAALAGLYSITENTLRDYQDKVIETIGEKKEKLIKEEIVQDKLNANPLSQNTVIMTGKGDMLCYDELSGRYFKSNVETLRSAMNDANYNMRSDMYITLNSWYHSIGLEGIGIGEDIGWDIDHEIYLVFTSKLTPDNEPCLVVEYGVTPCAAFLR